MAQTQVRDRFRLPRWGQRGTTGAAIPAQLGFDNIVQAYGELRALDGVSLTVAPGELVCLLGHSGCGKTTLLRIAAGVEAPTSGRVLMDGLEVSGPAAFVPPERRGVGLMFQDYALFPHLTILENVLFGLKDLAAGEAGVAARRALARVGLERAADDFPHTLSGGEQQRVGPGGADHFPPRARGRRAAGGGEAAGDRAASRGAPQGRAVLESRPAHARRHPR